MFFYPSSNLFLKQMSWPSKHCLIHGNHLHQSITFSHCFSHWCSYPTLLCVRPTQDHHWPPTRPLTGHTSPATTPVLGPLTTIYILFPVGLPIPTWIHIHLWATVLLVLRVYLLWPCWKNWAHVEYTQREVLRPLHLPISSWAVPLTTWR